MNIAKGNKFKKKKIFIVKDEKPEERYFEALEKAGFQIEYGETPDDVFEYDGLLIPGGVDVNPKLYNQENTASVNMNDHLDEITMNAIKLFFENGKAILGICRGLQILNVYFGGTLKQDIKNHKDTNHNIKINNKIISDYYGDNTIVNSIHHQCIDSIGKDLIPVAYSDDGIIEIILHKNNKILGTQFHPEKMQNGDKIFEIFASLL